MDRAALDVALALGMSCGGWCPRGRKALDGPIPDRYPLREAESSDYNLRTRLNARDSDATLVLNCGRLSGGTAYTVKVARELGRPCLVVSLDEATELSPVLDWLEQNQVHVLNVAGPRESKCPGIHEKARAFLEQLLPQLPD